MSDIVRVGRPSKIGQVDLDLLCSELESGVTVMSACQKVGISDRLFYKWRLLGQDVNEEEVFQNFYHRTELARAKAQNDLLDIVINNAQFDPKSAMWLLERMYPEQFSLKHEFRKTKYDIKEEELKNKPEVIQLSFGDSPHERAFERAVKRQAFETFIEENNLEEKMQIDREELIKLYVEHLESMDKSQDDVYDAFNTEGFE